MEKGEEEVGEMLADGLHWFPMTEITAHAWTDSSIGWHLDLIHRLLKIKETDSGGVSNEKYKTHKKERQYFSPIVLHSNLDHWFMSTRVVSQFRDCVLSRTPRDYSALKWTVWPIASPQFKCGLCFSWNEGYNRWNIRGLAYPLIHCAPVTTYFFYFEKSSPLCTSESEWTVESGYRNSVSIYSNNLIYLRIQMKKYNKRFKYWHMLPTCSFIYFLCF